ncbi:MAG: hypothetical protein AB2A00_18805 [Myxococcota bacterium]
MTGHPPVRDTTRMATGTLALLTWMTTVAAAPDVSVLILPIEPKGEVARDHADILTVALTSEAGRLPGYKVTSYREVQNTMTQEQARMVAGCDQASCAAEIAGALNADEIVMGTLGRLERSLVLSVTRVRARDATVVARVQRTTEAGADALLKGMPAVVTELFAVPVTSPPAAPTEPVADASGSGEGSPVLFRALGAACLASNLLNLPALILGPTLVVLGTYMAFGLSGDFWFQDLGYAVVPAALAVMPLSLLVALVWLVASVALAAGLALREVMGGASSEE